jgi:hypothetical protein
MAGELWRQAWQIGKEVTPGTAVAATRLMYFNPDSKLKRDRGARPHKFATGSRDNPRAFTLGPEEASGEVSMPLSASELVELFLMGIKADVTPTQPDAVNSPTVYLWTFTPGTSLNSATLRWDDGARPWKTAGCQVSSIKIAGSVKDETTVTASIIGRTQTQEALTAALTARTPDFIEGWETKLYIDAFGGTAGSTNVPDALINWEVEINNNQARKYWANNSNATSGIVPGELEVKAKLTVEAAVATALTEYNNWNAATKRLVRLEFGQNEIIEDLLKKFVTLDMPGAWAAVDLGGDDEGTRAYELSLQYVYDTTNTWGFQGRLQNARSTAW